MHEILSPYGFNNSQVNDILTNIDSESGRRYKAAEWEVVKDREKLLIAPIVATFEQTVLPEEGEISTPYGLLRINRSIFNGTISKKRNIATLDAEKLEFPLTLRSTRKGDRFHPFGMRGTKLVSDYLTDIKRNVIEKEQQLVVTDARDNILWLVGERPSALCSVNGSTTEVITLEWI